jgi:CrcB protein
VTGASTGGAPIDSDVDTMGTRSIVPRPIHLRPTYVLLVALGGAAGTAARYGISLVVPTAWQLPLPTFTVNVTGAFLLGLLLESIARRGRDEGVRRTLRLLVGTGFMGGFTTYSTLAVDATGLLRDGRIAEGIGYGIATVVVGLAASVGGILLAAALHRARVARAGRRAQQGGHEPEGGAR